MEKETVSKKTPESEKIVAIHAGEGSTYVRKRYHQHYKTLEKNPYGSA